MEKSKYFVLNPDGLLTHRTSFTFISDAEQDAKQLARLVPGREVLILKTVKAIVYTDDPYSITEYKEQEEEDE